MTHITIVSPGYPHQRGGVTDHTARLCRNWSQDGRAVQVWSDPTIPAPAAVAEWSKKGVRAVLIQYVPFLYGRRGVSSVPEQLALEAHRAGMRVTTFVHEPWVPPTRLPWLLLTFLQRRQLRRLVRVSDAVVTPVPTWAARLGPGAQVVYVGSTLGDPPPHSDAPPLTSPVVFSPFAAGLNWTWVTAAAGALNATPPLMVLGASEAVARQHPILRRVAQPGWIWYDRRSPEETLSLLSRSRLVLAPFVDGLTGRRTSALAAASTGARVLSTRGPLYDPRFDEGPIVSAGTEEAFVAAARDLWHSPDPAPGPHERRERYHRLLDPRRLDEQLAAIVGDRHDPSPA